MSSLSDTYDEIMHFRFLNCLLSTYFLLMNQPNTCLVGFGLLKEGKKKINVLRFIVVQ
jgi:hypothetical protein